MPEDARSNEKVFCLFKMCVASSVYHRQFLEQNLHSQSNVRASIFLLDRAPLDDYVITKYPWNKTASTPQLTGIPPDVLVLSEFESMRKQVDDAKNELKLHFDESLKNELDERSVGGLPYKRMNEMMEKMDGMMKLLDAKAVPLSSPMNVDDTLGSGDNGGFVTNEEEEEDVVIPIKDVDAATADQLVQVQTKKQLQARQYTIGYHHGRMNPLPASWQYPTGITLIQLINLWLIGVKEKNVPPLAKLSPHWVEHFDKQGRKLSKMKQVMKYVEQFGTIRGVWMHDNKWDGAKVTNLWSAIWKDFDPYMRTETKRQINDKTSKLYHKSRNGQVAYTTIYKKLCQAGLLKGNKVRKRRKIGNPAIDTAAEERNKKSRAARLEEEREAEERARLLAASMLRDLSPSEQASVNNAVNGVGSDSEEIVRQGGDSVKRLSMKTLKPGQWLNDEVINYYLKNCLASRDRKICNEQPGRKFSHFFNSFFFQSMFDEMNTDDNLRGKYNYEKVKSWSKKVPGSDIFNLKYIICPCNHDNMHWSTAVIFMEEKRIQWYDSMGGTDRAKLELEGLMQYLKDEYKKRRIMAKS